MKRIIVLMTIGLLSLGVYAQRVDATTGYTQPKHEISIWGAYGLSTLDYNLNKPAGAEWDQCYGLGYLAGLGYNYFLNYHWSIGIGAEFQALTSSLDIKNFNDYYYLPGEVAGLDPSVMGLPLAKVTGNVSQDHSVYYINVPLQVKYQLDVWKQHKWYAAANAKFGVPFKGSFDGSGDYTALWRDDSPGQDYVTPSATAITIDEKDKEFKTKFNLSLGLETGMKWRLSNKFALYTGVFVDYGLLDIRKGATNLTAGEFTKSAYNTGFTHVAHNSILNSRYTDREADALTREYTNGKTAFTDKVNTLAAGLKLQLTFGFGSKYTKKGKETVEYPKPLSASEVDEIVARNTQHLIDAQKGEFQDLKDYLDDKFKKEAKEVEEGLRLETVWGFDLDKTVILPGNMTDIANRNLETLRNHPEVRVDLVGNTDEIASDKYNYDLGLRRAKAMKEWLVNKGISGDRLTTSSKGKTNPFLPNSDDANRRYNRRVEFIIVK